MIVDNNRYFRDVLDSLAIEFEYEETTCGHDMGCILDRESRSTYEFIETWLSAPVSIDEDENLKSKNDFAYSRVNNKTMLFKVHCLNSPTSVQAKVFTIAGRELTRAVVVENFGRNSFTINLDKIGLSQGIYILNLTLQNQKYSITFSY